MKLKIKIICTFVLLLDFLLLEGCAKTTQTPPKVALPASYGTLSADKLPLYRPENIPASSADMKLTVDQKGAPAIHLRGFVILRPRASFRLEIEGALGSGTALACDGRKLTMINSYERTFTALPAYNLSQSGIIVLPLSCEELVALVQGFLPVKAEMRVTYDTYFSQINAAYADRGYYWRAVLAAGNEPPARLLRLELRKNRRAEPVAVIELADYQDTPLGPRPLKVTFDSVESGLKTTLKLDDYQEGTFTDDLFELQKPANY